MTEKREARYLNVTEVRAEESDGKTQIAGYAAIFEVETVIYDLFREKVARGAFADSIRDDDVRALWSHDTSIVLGRTKNRSLRLSEDDKGLKFELDLPDTQAGRDAFTLIKSGTIDGMSIGFQTVSHEWTRGKENELHLRTIRSAKLFEVSPVAFPAYKETEVGARSAQQDLVKEAESAWAERQKEWQEAIGAKRERIAQAELRTKRLLLNLKLK